jgi:hypothetical protein
MRMPRRVDEHYAILVEKAPVALDEHGQRAAVFEIEPTAAAAEQVGVQRGGDVERRVMKRSSALT